MWATRINLPNLIFCSVRASSPGRSGGGAGKARRARNYVFGIWIPPPISLWLPVDWAVRFPPISAKRQRARNGNERECKQYSKTSAKGNDVIRNVISANQHFASKISMQIFKFQRRSCKLFFHCRPAARVLRRACSQAIFFVKISATFFYERQA